MATATLSTPKKSPVALVPAPATPHNKPIHRADGREVRKHTIYLATELSQKLTTFCAETGKGLGTVITEALNLYLAPAEPVAPAPAPAPAAPVAPAPQPNPSSLVQRVARPLFAAAHRALHGLERFF